VLLDLNEPKHIHVNQRLSSEPTIWLSSIRPNGRPHLVPVWFLWSGNEIFIFAQPNSQKVSNLKGNPYVTLALEMAKDGSDIAIIEGTAALLDSGDQAAIRPAYTEKYSPMIAQMGATAEELAASYSQLIRVTPSRIISW
jgi:PPOX class probable F420-dependent enzyme